MSIVTVVEITLESCSMTHGTCLVEGRRCATSQSVITILLKGAQRVETARPETGICSGKYAHTMENFISHI